MTKQGQLYTGDLTVGKRVALSPSESYSGIPDGTITVLGVMDVYLVPSDLVSTYEDNGYPEVDQVWVAIKEPNGDINYLPEDLLQEHRLQS